MKMVYASRWMLDALVAAGKPKRALWDLKTLLGTLSPEDVAFYVAINQNLGEFIPEQICASFEKHEWNLDDPELLPVRDQLQRWKIAERKIVPSELEDEDAVLTCDVLDEDGLLFQHIVKKGRVFSGAGAVVHIAERVMRQLYTSLRFEELMALPVSLWYMQARALQLKPRTV